MMGSPSAGWRGTWLGAIKKREQAHRTPNASRPWCRSRGRGAIGLRAACRRFRRSRSTPLHGRRPTSSTAPLPIKKREQAHRTPNASRPAMPDGTRTREAFGAVRWLATAFAPAATRGRRILPTHPHAASREAASSGLRNVRLSAGFIPQERAMEVRRRQYLTTSRPRSSLRTQVRAPSRAARWSAGFIPQERAREAGRRQCLTPSRSRSSLRTQVRAPSRAARWGAGFIPQERAREAGRRPCLTPSRPRSSLRTQVRAPLPLREEPRHLGCISSLRVAGRDAGGPSPPEKPEMRTCGIILPESSRNPASKCLAFPVRVRSGSFVFD